ncbi:MAG: PAS domain-containing protein, partial [Acidobacteria bacterium]|nr:PAS domain-containing protein [Acidobacteriota bacterium]
MRTDPVDRLPPADPDTLDLFPDMVWIADGEGTVVFVNRAFRVETGYDGPVTPDIFERVVHPDEFARERARWRACVDEGKPFQNEVRLRTADGRYAWFRSRGTRIADRSGWIGVLTRITEERAARDRAALLAASNGLFVALTDPNDVIDGLLSILVPL